MGVDARLRLARLYLCTDARERQGDLPEFLAAVLAGGVDVVQIRQPGLRPEARDEALAVARAAAARHQALVGVEAGPASAGEGSADLVHLERAAGPAAGVRRRVGPQVLLGRSAHDGREVDEALAEDALDYLWVVPVQVAAPAPAAPPTGLDLVRHAAEVAPVFSMRSKPWFAAGGVTLDTLEAVLEAGARRVCVATAVGSASDPQRVAELFSQRLRAAWRDDPGAGRYTFAAAAATGRS